jgi:hypothetical protein
VELQPLEVSPKAWIWKPWRPGESPVILPFTWVEPTGTTYKNEKSAEKHKFNKAYKAERERETVGFLDELDRASNVAVPGDENHRFSCTHCRRMLYVCAGLRV